MPLSTGAVQEGGQGIWAIVAVLSRRLPEDMPLVRQARRRTSIALSDKAIHEYFAISAILQGMTERAGNDQRE